jgi:hypothetical protein
MWKMSSLAPRLDCQLEIATETGKLLCVCACVIVCTYVRTYIHTYLYRYNQLQPQIHAGSVSSRALLGV